MKGSSIFDDLVDVVTDQPMEDIQIEETQPEEVELEQEVETEVVEAEIEVEDENVMSFYEYLKDNSLIDEIEGFTGSPEQLQEHLNRMPETYLNAAISTLHPDSQALFDYVVALGDKADKNELQKFFDSYLNVEEVDLTDESVAYNYLEEKLKKMKGKTHTQTNTQTNSKTLRLHFPLRIMEHRRRRELRWEEQTAACATLETEQQAAEQININIRTNQYLTYRNALL